MCWGVWLAGSFEIGQESESAADSHGGDREDTYAGADEAVRAALLSDERIVYSYDRAFA